MEAFTVSAESAAANIEGAKQAIAARLHTSPVPTPRETRAIDEALNALTALGAAATIR